MTARLQTSSRATFLKPSSMGTGWVKTINVFEAQTVSRMGDNCYMCFLDKGCLPRDQNSREELLALFDIPKFVASRTCVELNGYFGCKPTYANGHIIRCSTWFRCLVKMIRKSDDEPDDTSPEYVPNTNGKGYIWFEMGIFTRWDSPGKCHVLCVDMPGDLPDRLKVSLEKRSSGLNFGDPFAMHVDLIDLIINYYDLSVWRIRHPVRKLEGDRRHAGQLFVPMHDVSRHSIHTSEVLSAMIETLQEMLQCQIGVYNRLPGTLDHNYLEQAKEYFRFQIQLVKNLKLRSDSNQRRLENEVNLAFNTIANQDNKVMKSIALLTMVVLPATFISALFSTAFFNFNGKEWKVSSGFWIYWTVTGPITIIVIVAFRIWMIRAAQI